MTTEEKAKAYDEALDKFKKFKEKYFTYGRMGFGDVICDKTGTAQDELDAIFPQLQESEDERIRKCLIEELKAAKSVGELKFTIPQPTREECIAYLEKQKERGPLTKEEEYILHRIIEYLEDETCPSEWISLLHDIYCLPYEKQKEQKPAEWSEEDMDNLHRVIRVLEDNDSDWKELSAWLKSLRPQYHGDVTMTEAYKMGLEAGKASSWKPSEEQMKALLNAEGFLRAGLQHDSAKTIAELYEQLKKL